MYKINKKDLNELEFFCEVGYWNFEDISLWVMLYIVLGFRLVYKG